MAEIIRIIVKKLGQEKGQALAEYSLILGFIAIVCVVSLMAIGSSVTQPFADFVAGIAP